MSIIPPKFDPSKFSNVDMVANIADSIMRPVREQEREIEKAMNAEREKKETQRQNIQRTADNTGYMIENLRRIEDSISTETEERKRADKENREFFLDLETKSSKSSKMQSRVNLWFGIIGTIAAILGIIGFFRSL